MLIELSTKMMFGFTGPNLCFLGSTHDFELLAKVVVNLTDNSNEQEIVITNLPLVRTERNNTQVVFRSKIGSDKLAVSEGDAITFVLDPNYWDRLFRFFVLMSWEMRTHYLNADERELAELCLLQDINFICSSEYPQLS